MTQPPLNSPPHIRDVVRSQVRAVGLALRGGAFAGAAVAGVATLLLLIEVFADGKVIHFYPHEWILPGLLGILLALGVWRAEDLFGDSFIWTLPFDRRTHVLAKVFAGWVWLLPLVGLFVLWLLGLAALSDGNFLAEQRIRFISPSPLEGPYSALSREPQTARWTPHPLLWLVPFTSATATYLLTSALKLGTTLRSFAQAIIGFVLAMLLIAGLGEAISSGSLILVPSRLMRAMFYEPYGLSFVLTATADFFSTEITLPSGETVLVGRGVPDLTRWIVATIIWTGAALLALWLAASRHRERRS